MDEIYEYEGIISKIKHNNNYTRASIYFKSCPYIKFYFIKSISHSYNLHNIQLFSRVNITYKELDILSHSKFIIINIKLIKPIYNNNDTIRCRKFIRIIENLPTVKCFDCGNSHTLNSFNKCDGVYIQNRCNKCYSTHSADFNNKCIRKISKCECGHIRKI